MVGSDDRLTRPLRLVAGVDTDPQPRLVLVTGYGDPVPHGIDQRRQQQFPHLLREHRDDLGGLPTALST